MILHEMERQGAGAMANFESARPPHRVHRTAPSHTGIRN
jgi:hypothetical protein